MIVQISPDTVLAMCYYNANGFEGLPDREYDYNNQRARSEVAAIKIWDELFPHANDILVWKLKELIDYAVDMRQIQLKELDEGK
jgi:hypothetical protein